jgi:hypothetical protein
MLASSIRIRGRYGEPIQSSHSLCGIAATKRHGYRAHQFDAHHVLGKIHLKSENVAQGQKELAALEHDARAKGFMLIARKAANAKAG